MGVVGGVLGVVTFGLSFYQWTVSQEQLRIGAAMDISRAYLQDRELRTVQNLIITTKPNQPYDEVHLRQRAFVDLNNYIAQLINEGRIDERYVSNRIKCDIGWLHDMVHGDRPDLAAGTAQISRYAKTDRHKGCNDG